MKEDLSAFKQLIKEHCGLQLEGIAEDRLRKALLAAATTAGIRQLQDFYPLLCKNSELVSDLVSQLTVNETYFFRENSQIELLTQHLLPRLLDFKNQPIKILSAGCSSGEEPYSLVMALEEAWGKTSAKLFQVEGGDLDRQVLHKARKGVYSPFSFRGVSHELRTRYFQPAGAYFQLREDIRERVTFHELNLLSPQFPAELQDFDVIFFRNVSIYFDLETREKIQHRLTSIMNPDGLLLVGSSETLANNLGVFRLVEEEGIYYFVKGEQLLPLASRSPEPRPVASSPVPASTTRVMKKPTIEVRPEQQKLPELKEILALLQEQESSLASRQLDRLLEAGQELKTARLLKAWLLGNRKEFHQAEQLLSDALKTDPWFLDALFLQALLCKWQGQQAAAIQGFKKAIYTRADCWPAHYYLAESLRLDGQKEQAQMAYQTAQRLLTVSSNPSTGLQWLPLNLQRADLLFLIEHQLLQIRRSLASSGTGGE